MRKPAVPYGWNENETNIKTMKSEEWEVHDHHQKRLKLKKNVPAIQCIMYELYIK